MSEQTDPIDAAEAPAADTVPQTVASAPSPGQTPATTPVARRTVTVPVLPLAIVGGIIVAVLFFGGGVAIGYGVGSHHDRDGRGGNIQQYRPGQTGDGDGNGFGFGNGNGGTRNGSGDGSPGQRPSDRPSGAPQQNG